MLQPHSMYPAWLHRPRTSTVPKASNPEQKAIEWGGQISNWCPDIQNKTRTLLWQELHSHRVRHCWRQPRLWSRSKLNTGAKRTQRLQHRGGKNRSLNKTRDTQFLFHYEYIKSLCGFFTPDGASHTCAPHSGQLPAMLPHDQGWALLGLMIPVWQQVSFSSEPVQSTM